LTVVRIGMAAVGLALAVLALVRFLALDGARREWTAWLAESGQPVDERLERELARETDTDGMAVRAVRASLARAIDAMAHTSPDRRQSALRLEETARRAAAVLGRRPASWEAAMVLGAATYMSDSQARDARLFTAHERWEAPLEAAIELAPTKREPARFLTGAYVEIWPALTAAKRERVRGLLAGLLSDPDDASLLLGPWLDAAGDRQVALAALPPEPRVWEQVQRLLDARGDWAGFSAARQRWNQVLLSRLQTDLAAADANLAAGDYTAARILYLAVLDGAQPDLAYRDLLAAALTRCPPGPVPHDIAVHLSRQVDWAVQRCLLAECALQPEALKRLARLAGEQQAAPEEAMALLLAGDLPGAAALERRAENGWSNSWVPYLLLKARMLAGRHQLAAAESTLAFVPRSWWERPTYWQVRLELAQAADDKAGMAQAEERLRGLARMSWPAAEWTWRGERARLEILAAAPAAEVEIDLLETPPAGAVVELWLDGALLGTAPARPGAPLVAGLPVSRGVHLIELQAVAGGPVTPGALRLR
jgi:hypothetical protein